MLLMRSHERTLLAALVLTLIVACAHTSAATRLMPGPTGGEVFTGPDGIEIRVLPVQPLAEGKRLIQVLNSGEDFDGKVLLCERESRSATEDAWGTKIHGRDRYVLTKEGSSYRAYLGRPNPVSLERDEAKSRELEPGKLIDLHGQQTDDGTLGALQKFDRAAGIMAETKKLASSIDDFQRACGGSAVGKVDWDSATDEMLLDREYVSGRCEELFDAAKSLCGSEEGKATIAKRTRELICRMEAGESRAVDLEEKPVGKVVFTIRKIHLVGSIEEAFRKAFVETSPNGRQLSLGDRIDMERTAVCSDSKNHVVAIAPLNDSIAYGDGKKLTRFPWPGYPVPPHYGYFLDPRHDNPKASPRGLRPYSSATFDAGKKQCEIRCGIRTVRLDAMAPQQAKEVLLAATYTDPPKHRVPHALARDTKGIYYMVDKSEAAGARDFNLYVGPKGNLKLQKMTNVVADSEGEVFSTKTGSLRFVIGKNEASWIRGKASTNLLRVPVAEDLPMIYEELGPYVGLKLGTPCDDL